MTETRLVTIDPATSTPRQQVKLLIKAEVENNRVKDMDFTVYYRNPYSLF